MGPASRGVLGLTVGRSGHPEMARSCRCRPLWIWRPGTQGALCPSRALARCRLFPGRQEGTLGKQWLPSCLISSLGSAGAVAKDRGDAGCRCHGCLLCFIQTWGRAGSWDCDHTRGRLAFLQGPSLFSPVRHRPTHLAVLSFCNATDVECLRLGAREGSRAVGNTVLLLRLGLPNPALQALCKLITASETGEQLISRVS